MNKAVAAASRLIAETFLRDICMVSGQFERAVASAADVEEPVMTIKHQAKAASSDKDGFVVRAMLHLQIFEGKGNTEADELQGALAEVIAIYELSYGFAAGTDFSEEALNAFSSTNGVFNAWPYFREFVQSSFSRLGLPAVLVPLFRLTPNQKQPKNAGKQVEES